MKSTRRSDGQSSGPVCWLSRGAGQESNLLTHGLRTGSRVCLKKGPTKYWLENYALYQTELQPPYQGETGGIRTHDHGCYKPCTPNRQSILVPLSERDPTKWS